MVRDNMQRKWRLAIQFIVPGRACTTQSPRTNGGAAAPSKTPRAPFVFSLFDAFVICIWPGNLTGRTDSAEFAKGE
jgi:hypothetical protein